MTTVLDAQSFALLLLEEALSTFAKEVGCELHKQWHPQKSAPKLPMEVAGKSSVINSLRNGKLKDGHNHGLKKWVPYWGDGSTDGWDWSQAQGLLDQIEQARHQLCHKADTPQDAAVVEAVVEGMLFVYGELHLDPTILRGLLAQLQAMSGPGQPMEVLAEERGGMRIPFSDPRKYLVGRSLQVEAVSTQVRSQPSGSRVLLYGESGTGKTVTAIAIAFEVC